MGEEFKKFGNLPPIGLAPAGHSLESGNVSIELCQCWESIIRAFRHFTNLLNRKVYGASFRHGKRWLPVIPILERDAEGRFHYHAAIEPPAHVALEDFRAYVRHCWAQTDWAYRHNLIELGADQGWVDYMLKLRQKSGFESCSDCIDSHNFYNGWRVAVLCLLISE